MTVKNKAFDKRSEEQDFPIHKCGNSDFDAYWKGIDDDEIDTLISNGAYCVDDPTLIKFDGEGHDQYR